MSLMLVGHVWHYKYGQSYTPCVVRYQLILFSVSCNGSCEPGVLWQYQLRPNNICDIYCYVPFSRKKMQHLWLNTRFLNQFKDKHSKCSCTPGVLQYKQLRYHIIDKICFLIPLSNKDRIGGVIVSLLVSSAVDRRFEARSGKTKNCEANICCFYSKHATLR